MPTRRLIRILCLLLSAVLAMTPSAWSWGREGHHIVARIAARNLKPETRKKLAAILGTNDAGLEEAMAAASTWPDEIDRAKTGTFNWHFVDVDVNAPFTIDRKSTRLNSSH